MQNEEAVNDAYETVSSVRPSKRTKRVAKNCAELISLSKKLLALVEDFPTSPFIRGLARNISDSSSISCSNDEKLQIDGLDYNKTLIKLRVAVDAIQEQLKTLTGSTVAPQVLLDDADAFSNTELSDKVGLTYYSYVCPVLTMALCL